MGATFYIYRTPKGRITIGQSNGSITQLVFGPARLEGVERACELTNRASSQVLEYLAGKRRSFDLPLAAKGTEFQHAVWNEMLNIPYGETRTYGQIAAALGKPKALQAVGQACGRNPIPIIVPCHRVVAAGGKLGGYAYGPGIKQFLLNVEAQNL